jgi:NAD(P)-dependent dehydrogenase (short-subunit alcohol dehydrogenase family)
LSALGKWKAQHKSGIRKEPDSGELPPSGGICVPTRAVSMPRRHTHAVKSVKSVSLNQVMSLLIKLTVLAVAVAVLMPFVVKEMSRDCNDYRVHDQRGKRVIVTGANAGLGYHTVLELAKTNATVIMGCRNAARCEQALVDILREVPHAQLDASLPLDVASFASVRSFVDAYVAKYDTVDVLINNAGVMALPTRQLTQDGLEAQLATNHFGHFLLTGLLLPHFACKGRIINHSSMGHALSTPAFPEGDIVPTEEDYSPWGQYGNTKLANLLFTFELNRRIHNHQLGPNRLELMSVAVHPGYSSTNLQAGKFPFWKVLNGIVGMHAGDGALSQIYAATDESVTASDNTYLGPMFRLFGCPAVQATQSQSWNTTKQALLWEESERLTGVIFDFSAV